MFKEKRYEIHQGDCFEIMDKLIEAGIKVDMILTDPPYGTVKGIAKMGMEGKVDWDEKLNNEKMFDK